MGFEVKQDLPSGFAVSYWSVQRLQINFSVKQASFTLLGYKDEQTYRNGGAHATTRDVSIRDPKEFDKFFTREMCAQFYDAAVGKDPLFAEATKA